MDASDEVHGERHDDREVRRAPAAAAGAGRSSSFMSLLEYRNVDSVANLDGAKREAGPLRDAASDIAGCERSSRAACRKASSPVDCFVR